MLLAGSTARRLLPRGPRTRRGRGSAETPTNRPMGHCRQGMALSRAVEPQHGFFPEIGKGVRAMIKKKKDLSKKAAPARDHEQVKIVVLDINVALISPPLEQLDPL